MTTIWAMIIVIGVLVFVHELGHYLAARSVGIRVEKFSVGFPPRFIAFFSQDNGWLVQLFFFWKSSGKKWEWKPIWNKFISVKGKKGTGTEYCIALVPLGGYVKMAGIIDESMDTKITFAPDEFMSKSYLAQAFVMSAGVIMNILFAFAVYTGISYHYGKKIDNPPAIISQTVDDMPAEKAGILPGDQIISINGNPVNNWGDMVQHIKALPNKKISIELNRDGEILPKNLITSSNVTGVDTVGIMGVYLETQFVEVNIIQAAKIGIGETISSFGMIVMSLKMLFSGEASISELGGPIMIAQLAGETARAGVAPLLMFMALISVNLAFLNILPIPGLDGGHIFITLVQSIIRRPLSLRVRMILQQIGMTLLLMLMVTVMFNDIVRLFTN